MLAHKEVYKVIGKPTFELGITMDKAWSLKMKLEDKEHHGRELQSKGIKSFVLRSIQSDQSEYDSAILLCVFTCVSMIDLILGTK